MVRSYRRGNSCDDGGSSGRLRGELGMLPPGNIRSCLPALADTEPLMEKLFHHRFSGGAGLEGHNFGNLLIAAMTEMFGFQEAVKLFGRVLTIRGLFTGCDCNHPVVAPPELTGKKIVIIF